MLSLEMNADRSEKVRYDYTDYPMYIRRGSLSAYPGYAAPAHWHDDIEFVAVLSGEMQYNINGEIVTLTENKGIFVNARQMHFGFSAERKECDFICILLHPLMLCVSPAFERQFAVPVLEKRDMPYITLSADTPWQKELLNCLLGMYDAKDDVTAPLIISSLFLRIWSLIFKNSEIVASAQSQSNDLTLLKNMMSYIQQCYHRKITLSGIAAAGAVGQSKCCKLFDQYTGSTPNAYLVQYRLNQSVWYLENTDMTVTEIAHTVGFSSSSYYAETFRKWYDSSPSEYRKAKRV